MAGKTGQTTDRMSLIEIAERIEADLKPVTVAEAEADLYNILGVRCNVHAKLMRTELQYGKQWFATRETIITADIASQVAELINPIIVNVAYDFGESYGYRTGITENIPRVAVITLNMTYPQALEYAGDVGGTLFQERSYRSFQSGDQKYDSIHTTWLYSGPSTTNTALEGNWDKTNGRVYVRSADPTSKKFTRGARRIILLDVPNVIFQK